MLLLVNKLPLICSGIKNLEIKLINEKHCKRNKFVGICVRQSRVSSARNVNKLSSLSFAA